MTLTDMATHTTGGYGLMSSLRLFGFSTPHSDGSGVDPAANATRQGALVYDYPKERGGRRGVLT